MYSTINYTIRLYSIDNTLYFYPVHTPLTKPEDLINNTGLRIILLVED